MFPTGLARLDNATVAIATTDGAVTVFRGTVQEQDHWFAPLALEEQWEDSDDVTVVAAAGSGPEEQEEKHALVDDPVSSSIDVAGLLGGASTTTFGFGGGPKLLPAPATTFGSTAATFGTTSSWGATAFGPTSDRVELSRTGPMFGQTSSVGAPKPPASTSTSVSPTTNDQAHTALELAATAPSPFFGSGSRVPVFGSGPGAPSLTFGSLAAASSTVESPFAVFSKGSVVTSPFGHEIQKKTMAATGRIESGAAPTVAETSTNGGFTFAGETTMLGAGPFYFQGAATACIQFC